MIIRVLILFLCFPPAAFALRPGECRAIPESKVYLSDHFSVPYPRSVEFTCLYECMGTGQKLSHEVLGTSKVKVRNESDDAFKVVCQGVKLKRTSWGYGFDQIIPFYAYETQIKELRSWAEDFVSKDNVFEQENLQELKSELEKLASAYKRASDSGAATSKSFELALGLIIRLAATLPEDTQFLDSLLDLVRSGQKVLPEDNLANQLVTRVLNNLAYWR